MEFARRWFRRGIGARSRRFAAAAARPGRTASRVLMIDQTTPDPSHDAGSYAAVQEIRLMLSLGCNVSFLPQDMQYKRGLAESLEAMGVVVLPGSRSASDPAMLVANIVRDFDLVYVTRFDVAELFLPVLRSRAPDIPVLFNNADLHFLREIRAVQRIAASRKHWANVANMRRRELAVCQAVDAVLCYTSAEHAVITSHVNRSLNLQLTPWVVEPKRKGPEFQSRTGMAFLGNFQHQPNVEAMNWFMRTIMPRLAEIRADIRLYVYGSNMPESLGETAGDNVELKGFVEDLDVVYHSHRIFVAPLFSGAGIKGKVLDAMGYGTPVITSEIGAEGTGLVDRVSARIPMSEAEWVSAILELYDNENAWSALADNARVIAQKHYSFEYGQSRFRAIFESVGLAVAPEEGDRVKS